jgi:hypothetical protein
MGFIVPLFVKMLTSEAAKVALALLFKKLLESKSDGVTKDVAETALDAIALSRSNNAPKSAVDAVKAFL